MTPHLEAGGDTGNNEDGGSLIFVSDASAEAERLTTALRGRGYPVIDVPLGLLVSRVSVQRPALILCDADATTALEAIQRVREIPGGNRIDVLFLGEPGRAVERDAALLEEEASAVFVRPVDELILLRKVEALIGAPSEQAGFNTRSAPPNRAPVLVAATRRPYRYDAGNADARRELPSAPSASAPGHAAPSPPLGAQGAIGTELPRDSSPHSTRPMAAGHSVPPRPRELPQSQISPALESLLATAEQRVRSARNSSVPPSDRLSPEAELDAILPADVLDALDEPLDFDDDEDEDDSSVSTSNPAEADVGSRSGTKTTGAGAAQGGTGDVLEGSDPALRSQEKTVTPVHAHEAVASSAPDSRATRATEPPITPPRPSARQHEESRRHAAADERPPSRPTNPVVGTATQGATTDLPPSFQSQSDASSLLSTVPPAARPLPQKAPPAARPDPPKLEIPTALSAGDAVRAFARVVRARYTGALAFEDATGIRRVLFRDGDFVTAASGAEGESLVQFLTQRGDLPGDVAARIGRKLPQFGRHAGAALIAQGHLRQDDLWPVLRSHAEWLVGRIALLGNGAASLENDVPARLQAEPAVFGGATGAEVLVEIVRRAISPEQAVQRLGGANTLLQKGENPSLLGECAISDAEVEIIRSIAEEPVSVTLRRAGHKDFAAVLYVLVELSVLSPAIGERRAAREQPERRAPEPDHLDHAALRARILARKALSEEGDYFALLGVSRNATSYDIRRAYASLRDEYDPARILTGETVDLKDDVDLVLEVLGEAYEILEDDLRRERYRRALDASP